jgi:hypothetical protein
LQASNPLTETARHGRDGRGSSNLQILLFFLLASIAALLRAHSYHDPPEWDIGTYCVVANELNHGRSLYADTWDMKPPGIFYTYALAQRIVPPTHWKLLLYVLSLACAIATLAAVCTVARHVCPAAAIWTGAFWVALCFEPYSSANMPNCESFMNAATVLGWAIVLRRLGPQARVRGRVSAALLAGVVFGWATTYKQVAILPALTVGAAHVLSAPRGNRRRPIIDVAVTGTGIALVWTALATWFALTGRAWLLWQTVVVYSRDYAGNTLWNITAAPFLPSSWTQAPLRATVPAAAFTAIAIVVLMRDPDHARRRFGLLLLAMLVGTWLAVAVPGKWLGHYFQLSSPALAVGAGAAAAKLVTMRLPYRIFAGVALLATLWPQTDRLTSSTEDWLKRRYGAGAFLAAREEFLAVDKRVAPDEHIYIWGDEPWLYVLSARRCAYAAVWRDHAVRGPMADFLTARTLQQLQENPPAVIACFGGPWPEDHAIMRWMNQHYAPMTGASAYPLQFFERQ